MGRCYRRSAASGSGSTELVANRHFGDSKSLSQSLNGLDLGGHGDGNRFRGFEYDGDLMGGIG
ncbi:hypothetical protein C1H46_003436 [Malus baccata]|uniref:Uncharacterized protein n=1 Tax=Malus baccata TaxID=106549 RepID=A0A540NJ13_MALBA|nr:hypothetical protein C1H46_003436 [Malus baccata]